MVTVIGDVAGKARPDPRLSERVLSAATAAGAGQFVLVTPLAGGSAIGKLGKLEEAVRASGLNFSIVRVGKDTPASLPGKPAEPEAGLVVGPLGTLTPTAKATKGLVRPSKLQQNLLVP